MMRNIELHELFAPISNNSFFLSLKQRFCRLLFGTRDRIEAWQLCHALLVAGFDLAEAFKIVAETFSLKGEKTIAGIFKELEHETRKGRFLETILKFVPASEAMLFSAYGSAELVNIFSSVTRLAKIKKMFSGSLIKLLVPPLALLFMIYIMLWGMGLELIPSFMRLVPIENWTPFAKYFGLFTIWIGNNLVLTSFSIIGVITALWATTIYYTGFGRVALDNIPPFSLYRFVTGVSFLFTAIELMNAGIDLNTQAFKTLEKSGSPYLRSRIQSLRYYRTKGYNLGRSMVKAGQGFPSPELIPIIVALDGKEDWENRLRDFSNLWIETVSEKVQAKIAMLNAALYILLAATAISAIYTVYSVFMTLQRAIP